MMEGRAHFVAIGLIAVVGINLPVGPGMAWAGTPSQPVYKPAYEYPVLDEIENAREALQVERDSLQRLVDQRYEDETERERVERQSLRLDWSAIDKPANPDAFDAAFHFPPVPQYSSGTCWAFCSTSFFESEVYRVTGRKIKLSEMWTVYWEYVEKARRFVREYGHSNLSQGSQDHATREIYRQYGAVPTEAYPGILKDDERFDHNPLSAEFRSYLHWIKENNYWNEQKVVTYVRSVLDDHMGAPPEEFQFEGHTYTPRSFLSSVLKLNMDDYVNIVSTIKEPFGEWILFDVHDNWRRLEDYLNLPLDDFYSVIKSAVTSGYTVSICGDVSEPGLDGMEDAAVIPTWDIPPEYIDQSSREYRIEYGITGDDHGVHAVGFLRHNGRDWFLVKDSNRSSRLGKFKGYYFYDGDYIRLKMLAGMVHKDRLEIPEGSHNRESQ
ncbi:MAG: peptidase C1 [Candidatus Eisenbacteria sp.]|nr:peptidase C1 [Candidatus Eisenbacteria bacterium]